MKLIPLTQGKFAQVDDCDYDYLMQWKWYLWQSKCQVTEYAVRQKYTPAKNGNQRFQRTIRMHQQLLGLSGRKILVDHKDFNGLNNQVNNTRVATSSQNNAYRRVFGESKYCGVSPKRTKYRGRVYTYYTTSIQLNKKRIYIGTFKSEVDAAIAYDKKAKELHGEFAFLNFP